MINTRVNHIWEEYHQALKSYIKTKVPTEQDAEDILQETFIKIYNNIEKLMDDSKLKPWVYSITRNTIVDYYRARHKIESVQFSEALITEDTASSFNKDIANCLKTMITTLPDNYKQAIILTEFKNFTQKELSEQAGITISGAKSRVQRARYKLKKRLLDCCNFEFDRLGNIIDYEHKKGQCKYC